MLPDHMTVAGDTIMLFSRSALARGMEHKKFAEEFAALIASDHRTNQQSVIRMLVDIVVAYHTAAGHDDLRNEDAVAISKKIEIIREDFALPYI